MRGISIRMVRSSGCLKSCERIMQSTRYYFCCLIHMKNNESSGLTNSDLYFTLSIRMGKTDHHQKQYIKASSTTNTLKSVSN